MALLIGLFGFIFLVCGAYIFWTGQIPRYFRQTSLKILIRPCGIGYFAFGLVAIVESCRRLYYLLGGS